MNKRIFLKIYTLTLIIIIYIPLILTIIYSFSNSRFIGEWGGFTTKWYSLLLRDTDLAEAVKNSLIVAILSSIFSIILSVPIIFIKNKIYRKSVELLLYPPIIIPEITEAVSLMLFFIYIKFPLGMISVFIGHTAFNVAYAYLVLQAGAKNIDELVLAARSLGASPLQAYLRVVTPILTPTIAAAASISFLMSFTDFTKTLFTAGPGFKTLTVLLWNRARRPGLNPYTSQPYLAAITSLIVVTSIVIILSYMIYSFRLKKRY